MDSPLNSTHWNWKDPPPNYPMKLVTLIIIFWESWKKYLQKWQNNICLAGTDFPVDTISPGAPASTSSTRYLTKHVIINLWENQHPERHQPPGTLSNHFYFLTNFLVCTIISTWHYTLRITCDIIREILIFYAGDKAKNAGWMN